MRCNECLLNCGTLPSIRNPPLALITESVQIRFGLVSSFSVLEVAQRLQKNKKLKTVAHTAPRRNTAIE